MEKLEIPFADVKVLDNFRTGLNSKCGYFASLKKEYYFVAHSQTFIKKKFCHNAKYNNNLDILKTY